MLEPNLPSSTLRDRFCAHYGCADSEFESCALRMFLHPPWSALAPMILRLRPGLLTTDVRIVSDLGKVDSRAYLASEVRDLRYEYVRHKDNGMMRRALRLRVSGERVLAVSKEIWK